MKTRTTKQLIALLSTIVVVLVALHAVAFYFIRSAGVNVSTLERDGRVLDAQVAEFSKYSNDDLRKLATSIMAKIISRDGIVPFIENIERTARGLGMEINIRSVNVVPRADDPADPIVFVRLELETRGSWKNSMRFVSFLEYLPYKVELKKVSFDGTSGLAPVAETGAKVPVSAGSAGTVWRGQIELTALKFK
jgi:hypothetical protein